jgi:transposase
MVEEGSIDTEICCKFVLHLLRHIGTPVILVWDNNQSHHANRLRELVMAAEGRLHLEFLPPYAPELNPDEYVWAHLKKDELANLCPKDLPELKGAIRHAVMRTRVRPRLLRGFLLASGLSMAGLLI